MIERSALIFRVHEFCHDIVYPRGAFQFQLCTQHPVFEGVDKVTFAFLLVPLFTLTITCIADVEHRGIIFKEVVGIDTQIPSVVVEVQAQEPTAQMVAFGIGIGAVSDIVAYGNKSVEKRFQPVRILYCQAIAVNIIRRSAKLTRHLQTQLQRHRVPAVVVTYLQIACLRVIQGVFDVAALLIGESLLPSIIRLHSIGNMTFQVEPALGIWYRPVVGQCQTHLRNRTGIDAQSLRTRRQFLVLQFHGLLLATDRQHALQPAYLGIGLLYDHRTGKACSHSHIQAIANAPAALVVNTQWTLHGTTKITVAALQRTQTKAVGIEPQGCFATRQRGLHLHLVVQTVQQRTLRRSLLLSDSLCLCRQAKPKHQQK